MEGHRLALSPMDLAIAAQTYPGRPMTTHHGVEFEAPVEVARVRTAVRHLAEQCEVLRSTLRGTERVTTALLEPLLDAAFEAGPGRAGEHGWLAREFELARDWPFRVRLGELVGARELVFSLHHGVTDGHGALRMFDWLLRSVVQDVAPPSPLVVRAPRAAGPVFWSKVAANAVRQSSRLVAHRATLLDEPGREVDGFDLHVVDVGRPLWAALKVAATRRKCTRNTLLWCAALRASQRLRPDNALPFRLVGGVDLREFFGTHEDPRNWIGTLEADFEVSEVQGAELEQRVDERLQRGRRAEQALVSPWLMRAMSGLGRPASRALYRWTDSGPRPFMYSMVLSHLRPGAEVLEWPAALQPRRLWCASTVPRKPGVGLTLTTVGEHVTLAACWARPLLERTTAERLVALVLEELEAYGPSSSAPWQPSR